MSNETRLYGYIAIPRWTAWEGALEHNLAVIGKLPEEGEWPWLIRGMFSVAPERVSYRHHLIYFAADVKGLDEGWGEWLGKFEALLRKMRWFSVRLHLETEYNGNHWFTWLTEASEFTHPVTEWTFAGGLDQPQGISKPLRCFDT